MPHRPPGGRGLIALAAAAVLAAVPLSAAAATTPSPTSYGAGAPGPAFASASDRTPRTVTLLTGDKVTLTRGSDGRLSPAVKGPDGLNAAFETHTEGADTYVYPHSVLQYVAAGLLDKDLFNVTQLLADGYDDQRADGTAGLPLIVTYTDAATKARRQSVPGGAHRTHALTSIQGAAVTADRPADFWRSVTAGATPTGRTTGKPALAGGIAKIWLDGKVKADLADSVKQIGAPELWQTGNTGQGVDVAVLDTGIDQEHPDLDDRVAATESFVPEEDVTDRHGHGTHVASTIAGTGDASNGLERGVAPGARLHIGKVLDNFGSGYDSWIIAGMEWAARDQHAKIISMSLGAGPTDGTDPMSQAVNDLSAETGALFTIAAGNAGPYGGTVGAPGAADAALTVGAVDGADALADFSSRGPRAGDGGLKPEITAPGVDILAARSQYAPEGDGFYQTMSGTSMATPHVAGAAALLAAQHPDWSGRQLKDALVSTARTIPQYGPFDGGSGRLDIAATSKAKVLATASAYSGYHGWPSTPGETVDRTVTYTNLTDAPVTLDLSTDVPGAPAGLFALSAQQVTVPAHGTSTVTVTSSVGLAPTDRPLAGRLVAVSGDGAIRATTLIGIYCEGERHNLTVKVKDRDGGPLSGMVIVAGKKIFAPLQADETGTAQVRLPPGKYTAWMDVDLPGVSGAHSLGLGLLSVLDVPLDQDRTAVLDAGKVRRVVAVVPQASEPDGTRVDMYRGFGPLDYSGSSRWPNPAYDGVWATPTPAATEGEFVFGGRWRLVEPAVTLASSTGSFDDVLSRRAASPLPQGRSKLDAVFVGEGDTDAYRSVQARGKVAVVRRSDVVSREDQAAAAVAAGVKVLAVVNDGEGKLDPWVDSPWAPAPPPVTVATLTHVEGERLIGQLQQGRRTTLTVTTSPAASYLYDLSKHWNGVPDAPVYKPGKQDLSRINVSYRNYRAGWGRERRDDTWVWGSTLNPSLTPVVGDRTDWVTAGVPWQAMTEISNEVQESEPAMKTYAAGASTDLHWFGPIQRPRLSNDVRPLRLGDTINAVSPGWGDSGGDHYGTTFGNWDVQNQLSLYEGDKLLGQDQRDQLTVRGLSLAPTPYRLVSENSRGTWTSPYSTSTRTEWGFTSAGGKDVTTLPQIQLDYGVELDKQGRAERSTTLTVVPSHLAGGPASSTIGTTTLDVSYDDGATWAAASLRRTSAGWTTTLHAPRQAAFVTLRAKAHDAGGNSVDQRITRAFGLR